MASPLFATKPVDRLVADTQDEQSQLKRAVGLLDLTALGIGAIIGTGIFVILGEAIGDSGPSIILSFALAGLTCMFSALAYAEMASSIPVSGSAYTYAYATMGELMAWIIGWDLILEYGISVAAVAVGWGQYFNDLLDNFLGITLPESLASPPGDGGTVNIPAAFLVLAVTALLIFGVRETARTNTVMVFIKTGIILLFIVLAATGFSSGNLTPFAPEGFNGVVTAASLIFFAYIGFDAISTSGEETKNPQRDLPIAILGALGVCTVLYILVALTASAAMPYTDLAGKEAPLAEVLRYLDMDWGATVISFGALIAITSVVLTILYGQTRIMFAMSTRDGRRPAPPRKLLAPPRPGRGIPLSIAASRGPRPAPRPRAAAGGSSSARRSRRGRRRRTRSPRRPRARARPPAPRLAARRCACRSDAAKIAVGGSGSRSRPRRSARASACPCGAPGARSARRPRARAPP